MTDDKQGYDVAAIRRLLLASFTPEELRRFCQDRMVFRTIVDDFSLHQGLNEMVDCVIGYCTRRALFDEILTAVQQARPRTYAQFEPDLVTVPWGQILEPEAGRRVGRCILVRGRLRRIPKGDHVWLAVRVGRLLWPKEPEVPLAHDQFDVNIHEGGNPPGGVFFIVLLWAKMPAQEAIVAWLKQGRETGDYPGLEIITNTTELDAVQVRL